jgi:hypothetical protein
VRPDITIGGRYLLKERVGRGGMGEVWRATHVMVDRPVAIKIVLPGWSSDLTFARRFRREAQIAASLDHPGITTVYDLGEENGRLFVVMEWLDGGNLDEVVQGNPGGLPVDMTLDWGRQIAEALAYAHAEGVVHRDVKPANLMLKSRDNTVVKVCDFGIARSTESTAITLTGHPLGTAAYMAPEQCRGARVDGRADLYSLGCVMYELLTGHTPFPRGQRPEALMYQHVNEPPPPPRSVRPDIDGDIEALLLRLLAKDPGGRPADAAAVAGELAALLAPAAPAAPAPPAPPAVPAPPPAPPSPPVARGDPIPMDGDYVVAALAPDPWWVAPATGQDASEPAAGGPPQAPATERSGRADVDGKADAPGGADRQRPDARVLAPIASPPHPGDGRPGDPQPIGKATRPASAEMPGEPAAGSTRKPAPQPTSNAAANGAEETVGCFIVFVLVAAFIAAAVAGVGYSTPDVLLSYAGGTRPSPYFSSLRWTVPGQGQVTTTWRVAPEENVTGLTGSLDVSVPEHSSRQCTDRIQRVGNSIQWAVYFDGTEVTGTEVMAGTFRFRHFRDGDRFDNSLWDDSSVRGIRPHTVRLTVHGLANVPCPVRLTWSQPGLDLPGHGPWRAPWRT